MGMRSSTATVTVAVLSLAAAACGGGGGNEGAGGGQEAAPAAAAPAAVANAGKITGTILFDGAAPTMAKIDMSAEPTCADKHPDGAFERTVMVNDGKLENVIVYVKEGLPAQTYPAPTAADTLDQNGCQYHPHVLVLQAGQPMAIKNSDGILHNIKVKPQVNRPFNISQPTTMTTERTFSSAEVVIPVECNVHNWMRAYIAVLDNPYGAVSGADGRFEIDNLPPGNYVIETWHEKYGTQTMNVTVAPNEAKDIQLTYNAGMAGRPVPLGDPLVLDHQGRPVRGAVAGPTDR